MTITDLQECRHIVNTNGSYLEREVVDKLRSTYWSGVTIGMYKSMNHLWQYRVTFD